MSKFPELNKSKIGIVGMGYVGKNLFEYLKKIKNDHNIEIHSFDRSTIHQIKNQTFDYIFNCAGNTGDFRKQIWETINSNIGVTQFLIENVSIRKAMVLLSSSRIYGFTEDKKVVFRETDILRNDKSHLDIDFVYNGTKMLTESVALNLAKSLPYKITICRLSNLYGNYSIKDLDDSTYLKLMLRHKIENKTLAIDHNIFDTKGYIYIMDAVEGVILSCTKSPNNAIYNICSGKSYSIDDWIRFLNLKNISNNKEISSTQSNISIEKAQKELGFQPKYFLENLNINQIIKS